MRKAMKPNGEKDWDYIIYYINDVLTISYQAIALLALIAKKLLLNQIVSKRLTSIYDRG